MPPDPPRLPRAKPSRGRCATTNFVQVTAPKCFIKTRPMKHCFRRAWWSFLRRIYTSLGSELVNDGTTGSGEENCASPHVSKSLDNFQVSWAWTLRQVSRNQRGDQRLCDLKKKKKKKKKSQLSSDNSCFFTHNGITTPKTTREGQESTTKTRLHLAWPPKFKNQALFTPRAQNRFLFSDYLYFYAVASRNLAAGAWPRGSHPAHGTRTYDFLAYFCLFVVCFIFI